MRFAIAGSVTFLSVATVVACSSSTTSTSGGDGGASSSSGGSSGTSSSGGSSSGSSGKVAASTTAVDVTIDKDCPSGFNACGGTLSGTYDYTSGCLGDLFGELRTQCPTLDTTALKATVAGSIYFLANSALERDVTVKVAGDIKFPTSCVGGTGMCTLVETELKKTFDTASCTEATSNCTCSITNLQHNTAATKFTVADKTVTTDDGDKYDFCEQSGDLSYFGKTAEAEDGIWHLKKR